LILLGTYTVFTVDELYEEERWEDFDRKQKSKFPEEERSTLENYFREDVKQLQIILKQKMPWDWIE